MAGKGKKGDSDDRGRSAGQKLLGLVTGTVPVEASPEKPDWPIDTGIGVCCSGGGIRSASFCLGALQGMQDAGVLEKADYLASVSGGGYIAGALTMIAAQDEFAPPDFPQPFAPGSPEERFLRDHSSYLAYRTWGKLRLIMRLLLGMLVNVVFLGAFIVIFGRLAGHVAIVVRPNLAVDQPAGAGTPELVGQLLWTAAAIGAVGLICLLRTTLRRMPATTENVWFRTGVVLLCVSAIMAFVLAGLPWLIHQFRHYLVVDVPVVREPAEALGAADQAHKGASMIARLFALLSALGLPTLLWGAVKAIAQSQKSKLAMFAAGFVAPLVMAFAFIAVANDAVSTGWSWAADGAWFGAALVILVALHWSDPTTASMHPFYKKRLSSAFALERYWENSDGTVWQPGTPRDENGELKARARDYDDLIRLSKTKPARRWPTWVCCAAANISDEGETPPGRNALTFTFDSEWIGGPEIGWVKTVDFEAALPKNREEDITLPAAVAISGAALSPSMGKMTKPSLTMLLTIVNARLGVWLPNPRVITQLPEGDRPLGWARAGFSRLLREMMGNNKIRSKLLYVTDGGHWENLGLVELLRRGCTTIYCFDAAGDKEKTFYTIGEAIALARGELGVEISLAPDVMGVPDPDNPTYVFADHVIGTFTYPPDDDGNVVTGQLVFVKAEVIADAPWDVRANKEKDPQFPNHSLLEQMFADETFESYRALGYFSAEQAVDALAALGG